MRTAADLFHQGDWFFKFDYSSGYHHVEIFPEHPCVYRSSYWSLSGSLCFYEIQKALTKHWRSQGIRIFTYLDDGAGADSDFCETQRVSNLVRQDVQSSGFVANEEKSQWLPVQSGELLGYVSNLQMGTFQVLQKRVDAFLHVLQDVLARGFCYVCPQGSTFYRAPGFYEFGAGSSSTPVDEEFLS